MKTYLFSDSHLNHGNIATYCDRPANFTELIGERWNRLVKLDDVVIHLGDVAIGDLAASREIIDRLNGRKILVRGNHDRKHSNTWWMTKGGFTFSCDSMVFRGCWLTHEPAQFLPDGCNLNIHGHLHNIWHGFHPNASVDQAEEEEMKQFKKLKHPWQRLFACEYTNYCPVEFETFVSHPDKYFSRGISNDDRTNQ
jgi:calcineurin-like phosphoesterase family protein